MKIATKYEAGRLTVYLIGELDHHAARNAVLKISDAIDSQLPREMVLDLSELTFMDSSGIAVIVKSNRKLNSCGGKMLIDNPTQQPLKVLCASGVDRLVPIFAKGEVTT